ncbi:MAG TPA: hypothetical protein PLM29_07185 [Deltaproteobacteria bacterium]|nr:hypothetical protein [Deltaproteobacteria bacterium]
MQKGIIIVLTVIVMASFFIPKAVSSMEPVADDELKEITGSSGISMVIDDFDMGLSLASFACTDDDGRDFTLSHGSIVGQAGPARLSLDGIIFSSLHLNAFDPEGVMTIGGELSYFDPGMSQDVIDSSFRGLTLDLASGIAGLFWNAPTDTRTGLLVGLPSLNAFIDEIAIDGIAIHAVSREAWDNHCIFTRLSLEGVNAAILQGHIGFMSHAESGIDIGLDDIQIYLNSDEIRFTDTDGLWNPINDVYENYPTQVPYDGPLPAGLVLREVEIDTLRINTLVFTSIPPDDNTVPAIGSPGRIDAHAGLLNMDNFYRTDIPELPGDLQGRPLQVDITTCLPVASAIHQASGGAGGITGIHLALPTLEISGHEALIGGIYFDDPLTSGSPTLPEVINDNTSYMQLRLEESLTAILSGRLEISAH